MAQVWKLLYFTESFKESRKSDLNDDTVCTYILVHVQLMTVLSAVYTELVQITTCGFTKINE